MKPIPFRGNGQISLMAAPFIDIETFHQSGPERISMDISNHLQQVALSADENGLVAPSKKLSIASVAAILSLGIYTV